MTSEEFSPSSSLNLTRMGLCKSHAAVLLALPDGPGWVSRSAMSANPISFVTKPGNSL